MYYAVIIRARHRDGRVRAAPITVKIPFHSPYQAKRDALLLAESRWPTKEGWTGHGSTPPILATHTTIPATRELATTWNLQLAGICPRCGHEIHVKTCYCGCRYGQAHPTEGMTR